jgi:SAM-dependent methyltransferase
MREDLLTDLAVEHNLAPSNYFAQWNLYAEWGFRFLVGPGKMRPHHDVLDVGCGALRMGSLIIPYLDDDKYCGIDAHPVYVELGNEIMRRLGNTTAYQLVYADDLNFLRFGRKFDIAFAQSVLTHLSPADNKRCLQELKPVMKPGAKLYATVAIYHPESSPPIGITYEGLYPFIRAAVTSMDFYDNLAKEVGLKFAALDYPHPSQKVVEFQF